MLFATIQWDSVRLPLLLVLAAAVGIYLLYLERRTSTSRADRLADRYRTLSREQLDSLPDCDLLEAVIAHGMASQKRTKQSLYHELPLLSPGRSAVFLVWLICNEETERGFAALFSSQTARLIPAAIAGFTGIGASRCAAALEEAQAVASDDTAAIETAAVAFAAARQEEQPLALCVSYIRANPEEFVDPPATPM